MSASIPPPDSDAWDPSTREAWRELRRATDPTASDLAPLRERLASPPPSTGWIGKGAAAAVLVLGASAVWWGTAPAGPADIRLGPSSLSVDGVELAAVEGKGEPLDAHGTVRLNWVVGTVTARAEAADRLEVVTGEARWPVKGEGTLLRDQLGTHVSAENARCVGAAVPSDSGRTCLPVDGARWLGRGHALVSTGDLGGAADAYEAATNAPGSEAVRDEAFAGWADALLRGGSTREAAAVAERALADGPGTRQEHLHTVAAHAFLTLGDCASALPHLRSLPKPTPEHVEHIERCDAQLRSPR